MENEKFSYKEFYKQFINTIMWYYPKTKEPYLIDLDELTMTAYTGRLWGLDPEDKFLRTLK